MFEIIFAGMYSSVQDLGRIGYREFGVPVSGAMDQYSAKLANIILGNNEGNTLLEFTMIGPILKFSSKCQVVLTGAEFETYLDNVPTENNKIINIKKDQILKIGLVKNGCRGYLAIKGGIISENVLGSNSYYQNITENSIIKKGDKLDFQIDMQKTIKQYAHVKIDHSFMNNAIIEAMRGPEFELLNADNKKEIMNETFKISKQSNRMGYRLESDLSIKMDEIITSPVQPGTVQLTSGGQFIVLGRDAQTTGGYARIIQLTEKGQDCLAQLPIESKFKLEIK